MKDLKKIKKQLEYYFSNANFAKDKFLYETAAQCNNKVKIEVILTFKRMVELEATVEDVKEALKESDVVKVEDDCLIKKDMEEFKKYQEEQNVNEKTVAIKNLNKEMTLDEIEEFLRMNGCEPVRILMRRNLKKDFTGTCFVEFKTVEEAQEMIKKEISIEKGEEDKKLKVQLEIITKEQHLKDCEQKPKNAQKDKIKRDFVPKMYNLITEKECVEKGDDDKDVLTIKKIKQQVPELAFVDLKAMAARTKYIEEWKEKECDGFTLKKMSEEEATTYVDGLNITVKENKKGKMKRRGKRDN